ncbi:hypothetical protein BJ969_003249 [Saccharopolyspora gloriosae]|uniref:Uncharacterized protein n=1 Tax=Saccharopolyspora gloriosae TaxID=455344 RepID=A0A840NGL7_9PSEU|nr:hypothetical protein [Saccharopolyspora gloriosae]MBB5070161.1 hypothetical protein [Saccharopolyspora gloriosae]
MSAKTGSSGIQGLLGVSILARSRDAAEALRRHLDTVGSAKTPTGQ